MKLLVDLSLKPSDSPRMPEPVFIDTVGLFSPNEVCRFEVERLFCIRQDEWDESFLAFVLNI